jgi:hypothetical protein
LASSPLIAEPPGPGERTWLAPWAVAALRLDADRAVDLLCAVAGRPTLAAGIIAGNDLRFWAAAVRFAGSLVARQQFLPGLSQVDGSYRARWEPAMSGPDPQRLAQLARTMPSACRAFSEQGAGAPPMTAPGAALSAFVGEVVDYLVRSSAPPAPSASRARAGRVTKPSRFESLHDAWMDALQGLPVADGQKTTLR